ncbi:hypothetical protein [Ferrimicrobium sp.]|uniref:hypothetical protein n=1 Tax=Ferrimicrobium sp. TaxID=2926050 RepID=UPI002604974B|nr:hypothetical protein [Ferrimicrobium sp.]
MAIDRSNQQARLHLPQPLIDPTFSGFSSGLRPGRGTHDAVRTAPQYAQGVIG